jgi:hypothetical protein
MIGEGNPVNVQTPCPAPASLQALLDGKLPAAEEGPLSAHLESCVRCQQSLEGLVAGGDSWANLPDCLRHDATPSGEALRQALARAAQPTHVGETNPETLREADLPQGFLDPAEDKGGLGRLGPYKVRKVLGRGGMGVVLLAFDPALHREVAIKVMAPQLASLPSARQRFTREAQAAAQIAHDNVVTIHAVAEFKGLPYLVMQYVAGPSLEGSLSSGPLPIAEVVRVGREAARGLQAAHDRGLVHRDVKPANILVEVGSGTVKLTDFGLARAADDVRLTQSGAVAGTPLYMAPEQVRGETVDYRADLFSLGSVLYALCTGKPPFEAGNTLALLRKIADERPPSARAANPAVPRWLDAVIARLHAGDPGKRFGSAAEVVALLERHLAGLLKSVPVAQPLTVPGAPTVSRRPLASASRRLLAAVAAAVLLVGLGVAAFLVVPSMWGNKKAPPTGPAPYAGNTAPQARSETPAPAPAVPVVAEDKEKLARLTQEKLATYCYRCHGENGTVEGGLNYLMDSAKLVARKKVKPGEPASSRLLRRVVEGEMPPEGENPRPTKEDIALLERWVAAGAPAFAPPQAPRTFLSPAHMAQSIRDDLAKRKERDRRFTRYFTLTHLYNAGLSEDELQTYRNGLSKLLNSLSWEKDIVVPVPVDAARTVLRIDLRDYRWTAKEWDALLAVNPYGVEGQSDHPQYASEVTATSLPHLRGDWFVATASRPPLYHQLLQLPTQERELEKLLHIDAEADVRSDKVARAGFTDSGVSRNNRLIERHQTAYGAYWKSYDFAENTGEQNLFERPLGPGTDERSFRHVGGEIIFNLPNGLQGYMLVKGNGQRIDKGPTEVVSDPKRPDRAVENGLSCMSCHSRGINPKADQIRAHVLANRKAFGNEEVDSILALYPEAEAFKGLQRKDAERFEKAAAATGAKVGTTEPVMALAAQFEGPLDLRRAAAELGLTPEEFRARLDDSPEIGRAIGALKLPGGTVQRQTLVQVFPDMVREWELGAQVGGAGPQGEAVPLGGASPLPPYFEGADAGVSLKDGLRLKSQSYLRTKDSDLLKGDFAFEVVFEIEPGENIMVIGLGAAKQSIGWRIHRPDLNGGSVTFGKTGAGEEGVGKVSRMGIHVFRIERRGNTLTFSLHAQANAASSEVVNRTIPDLKAFAPFLTDANPVIFLGNGGKLKQVRLRTTPSRVAAPPADTAPPRNPTAPSRLLVIGFQPHSPKEEKEPVALSGPVADTTVGGAGRYLILRLAGKKKLGVFDVQQGKVTRELPLLEEDCQIAAGAERLVVVYPAGKLLQLWSLKTFEKERTVALPERLAQDKVGQISMGSASAGPLFALVGMKQTVLVDLATLEVKDVGWKNWGPSGAWGPVHLRSSPDGKVLLGWGGGWAGLEAALFDNGRQVGGHAGFPFSAGVFALPSADARLIFAPGMIANRGGAHSPFPGHVYLVPAVEPGFFLALRSSRELPWTNLGPLSLPPVIEVALYTDERQRLFFLKDIEDFKAGSDLPWEKRVFCYPSAGLLITLSAQKDRLVLRRVDLAEQLEKSGADYLAVVSRPPRARAGTLFTYKVDIRSKKGGVRVKLESGPEGMKVTSDGRVSWSVPAKPGSPEADVVLTIQDASGQELSHRFAIALSE